MKTVSRRGFFAALSGRLPAPAPPAPPPEVAGVVAAGQVFSLEDFYAARAAGRDDKKGETR